MAIVVVLAVSSPVTVGDIVSGNATASGGVAPYAYSISVPALPPGVTIDAVTGNISGNAETAGDYTFTVQAEDSTTATGTVDGEILVNEPLNSPSMPVPYRSGIQDVDPQCMKNGKQMVRLFYDAIAQPNFSTLLAGNLQQPFGLVKSLLFNVRIVQAHLDLNSAIGATLYIDSGLQSQRITIGPPAELNCMADVNIADIFINGCVPFFMDSQSPVNISLQLFGASTPPTNIDCRLFFANWEIPPFYFATTDNWTD